MKNAVEYVCCFQEVMVREACARGFDGAVCGHIHHAAIKNMDGILYLNDCDWVESCTALGEDAQGRLSIVRWPPFAELPNIPPLAEEGGELVLLAA